MELKYDDNEEDKVEEDNIEDDHGEYADAEDNDVEYRRVECKDMILPDPDSAIFLQELYNEIKKNDPRHVWLSNRMWAAVPHVLMPKSSVVAQHLGEVVSDDLVCWGDRIADGRSCGGYEKHLYLTVSQLILCFPKVCYQA